MTIYNPYVKHEVSTQVRLLTLKSINFTILNSMTLPLKRAKLFFWIVGRPGLSCFLTI